jgi:hypothetical protein
VLIEIDVASFMVLNSFDFLDKASNHIWRNGWPGAKTNYRLQKLNLTLRVKENPLNVLREEFCKRPSDLLDEECQRLLTALGEGWVELLGPKHSNNRTVGAEVEAETEGSSSATRPSFKVGPIPPGESVPSHKKPGPKGKQNPKKTGDCQNEAEITTQMTKTAVKKTRGQKKHPPKKRVVSDESEDAGETPSESSEEDRSEEGDESQNDGPSARQPGRAEEHQRKRKTTKNCLTLQPAVRPRPRTKILKAPIQRNGVKGKRKATRLNIFKMYRIPRTYMMYRTA